jgi:hypothetical protein
MDNQGFVEVQAKQRADQEIAQRIQVHKANIARMTSARRSASLLAVAESTKPLIMLAQGDSWFDYPLSGNSISTEDTDIIAQLRRIGDAAPTILNLAVHGETAINEMSLSKQERMIAALQDGANWLDGKPDAILFSAGGNDIAGEQFCIFLDFNTGAASGLNTDRFSKSLGAVEACYLELFVLRDRVAPGVPVFGHCYDFAIPNGAHPICAGPWLKPSLDYCQWTTAQGTVIVHDALAEFRNMLVRLASIPANNFHLVDTQGTLTPPEWANELHPIPAGFGRFAQMFADALKAKFPGRI